jgi:hypothetical protein
MLRMSCAVLCSHVVYIPAVFSVETIEIKSLRYSWFDAQQTASEGHVDQKHLSERSLLRSGELMETAAGLIAAQIPTVSENEVPLH